MPFPYRGRFAPSPTGPLHFGSLIAALGSCLDARQQGGAWLLRMEDVDTSRNVPGAADDILRTLAAFGFEWDGPVLYQSQRLAAYGAALEELKQAGLAYGCACSRKEIADSATHAAIDGGLAYPGTCRKGMPDGRAARAWRLRVDNGEVAFIDRLQGRVVQHLEDVQFPLHSMFSKKQEIPFFERTGSLSQLLLYSREQILPKQNLNQLIVHWLL